MSPLLEILSQSKDTRARQAAVDSACASPSGLRIEGISLAGIDLHGLNLLSASISNVDLTRSRCCRTLFPPLFGCRLDLSDLRGCHFPRLEKCTLNGANAACSLLGARITDCDFSDAVLDRTRFGLNLEEIQAHFRGNCFARASFSNADAAGAYLVGSDFSDAAFQNARLSRANMSGTNLQGCDFRGANLAGTNFAGANVDLTCKLGLEQYPAISTPISATLTRRSIASMRAGHAALAFARALFESGECRVAWEAKHIGMSRMERIVFTGFASPERSPTAATFDCATNEMVRLYPWDGINHPDDVVRSLDYLTLDYQDWFVDTRSIEIEAAREHSVVALRNLARDAVTELFETTVP